MAELIKTRPILVTGALGLVGRAVVDRLRASGALLRCLDAVADPDRQVVGLDLAQDSWPWPEISFGAIVHCAARLPMKFEGPEAEAAAQVNRSLDERAIGEAVRSGAQLIYFSSGSVYGDAQGDIDEDTPVAPKLEYSVNKLAAEKAIAARGVAAAIFRLVAPYGERQTRPTVLRRFIDSALGNETLRYYGSGARTQDFLHVDDVAQAVSLAIAKRVRGTWVLASGTAITMKDLAHRVVKLTASSSRIEAAGLPDAEEGRRVNYNISRLRSQLGFSPAVSLDEGIERWAALLRQPRSAGGPT